MTIKLMNNRVYFIVKTQHPLKRFENDFQFQKRSDGGEGWRLPEAPDVERCRTREEEYDVLHETGCFHRK